MKDDCIRSSLIEYQSFFESQDQYQPKIPRLDVSSMRYAGIVHDVVQWKSIFAGSWCPLSLGSIGKKNTICLLLEFGPPSIKSIVDDRMKIKKHIQYGKYVGRIHSELSHCPVMKDQ